MKIKSKLPPKHIYDACVNKFGVSFDKGVIFAYKNTIYAKHPERVTPDLQVHESTHFEQQKEMGADKWWERYLEDNQFRLTQEVEAYRNQYKYACENYHRNMRKQLLKSIVKDLSGSMYGNLITKEEAKQFILNAQTRK